MKKRLLFCLCSVAVFGLYRQQTKGFKDSKITSNFAKQEWKEPVLGEDEKQLILTLLKGKFSYLGQGKQSFAFLAEDGKHVLKVFNNKYQSRLFWLQFFPWKKKEVAYCEEKLKRTFVSYEIASCEMKQQTGILYAHLNPSLHLPTTALIDNSGIEHALDLNKTAFLVQKKADMAYARLEGLIRDNAIAEAKASLQALLKLIFFRCHLGIADSDPLIRTNFGFIGQEAIQIDAGPFSKDPCVAQPEVCRKEIVRITTSLKEWLRPRSPELASFVEEEISRL